MSADFVFDPLPSRARRGRRATAPGAGVAAEIRKRRDALGLTLREAAALTGVSPTMLGEIERGVKVPSVRTYGRLRDGLGLTEPAAILVGKRAATLPLEQQHLATLAACVVSAGGAGLSDLAAALGVSIPAVREGLSVLTDRLAQVGLAVVDDGIRIRVGPLPFARAAVAAVTQLEDAPRLSDEQVAILCIVGYAGTVTRRRIEELRGEDCESLLRRMAAVGLVESARDDELPNAPNLYRLTAKALGALGHPTLESLQRWLSDQLNSDEQRKAEMVTS